MPKITLPLSGDLTVVSPFSPSAIYQLLAQLGFTQADQLVVVLCPLSAAVGGVVRLAILAIHWSQTKRLLTEDDGPSLHRASGQFARLAIHSLATMVVALAAGLLVALYFAGAIAPTRDAIGKLIALAMVVGFMAPQFFLAQEQKLLSILKAKPPMDPPSM